MEYNQAKLSDLANWILSNWETIKSYTLTAWNLVKKYVIDPVTETYNQAKQNSLIYIIQRVKNLIQ